MTTLPHGSEGQSDDQQSPADWRTRAINELTWTSLGLSSLIAFLGTALLVSLLGGGNAAWVALIPAIACLGLYVRIRRSAEEQFDLIDATARADPKETLKIRINRVIRFANGDAKVYPSGAASRYFSGIEAGIFLGLATTPAPISPGEAEVRQHRINRSADAALRRLVPGIVGAGMACGFIFLIFASADPSFGTVALALTAAVAAVLLSLLLHYHRTVPVAKLQAWHADQKKTYVQLLEEKSSELDGLLQTQQAKSSYSQIGLFLSWGFVATIILAYAAWPLIACVALRSALDTGARSGLTADERAVLDWTVDFSALEATSREAGRSLFYDAQGRLRGEDLGEKLAGYVAEQSLQIILSLLATPEGLAGIYGLAQATDSSSQQPENPIVVLLEHSKWTSPTEFTLQVPDATLRLHLHFKAWRWRVYAVSFEPPR